MTDVIRLADYTIRNFSIIKVRLIIHFQVMSPSIKPVSTSAIGIKIFRNLG